MNVLDKKVAIVTGAGRGIGKAVSLLLANAGARVLLTARTETELKSVEEQICAQGGEARILPADLAKDEDIQKIVDLALGEWGSIDYLINNAGWGRKGPIVKARLEDWDQTFSVNLRAPMLLSRLVLPTLLAKGEGAIINISSISGKMGQANTAAYSASKFGLIGFTQSLYEEVREAGIKVAVILPGFVDTPLIPLTRQLDRSKMIRPEDVAQAVYYVLTASPACCPVEIALRPQKSPYR